MPDPTRKTVSSSQVAALFGESPYLTEWQLFQWATGRIDSIDQEESERMSWGKRLQDDILAWAAEALRMEVLPHDESYISLPEGLGATPDGFVLDPQNGLGWIEAKNVDWLIHKQSWSETRAPAHIELQHQTQLMCPHPEHGLPKWGAIAVLVGGNEPRLLMREHLPQVQAKIKAAVNAFWARVAADDAPPLTGAPGEIEALTELLPPVERDVIKTAEPGEEVIKRVHDYVRGKTLEKEGKTLAAGEKPHILEWMNDARVGFFTDADDGATIKVTISAFDKTTPAPLTDELEASINEAVEEIPYTEESAPFLQALRKHLDEALSKAKTTPVRQIRTSEVTS